MEVKQLSSFALLIIVVGLLVGVGVLVLDKLSIASYEETTVVNDTIVITANYTNISFDNVNISTFTSIINATGDVWAAGNYTIFATEGIVQIDDNTSGCRTGQTCYANYVFDNANTPAALAFNSSRDAVSTISTTWLALIVTIGILSILLFMIVRSFGKNR